MNPKYRRLFITIIIVLTLGLATKLILMALEENIVYFYTPSDLIEKFGATQNIQNKMRIGGLVLESSIKKESEKTIFMITDRKKKLKLYLKGLFQICLERVKVLLQKVFSKTIILLLLKCLQNMMKIILLPKLLMH